MVKTVLITGATSGIGNAFAKLFAHEPVHLILVSRNEKMMGKMKDEMPHRNVTIIKKDLSAVNAAREVYQEVKQRGLVVDRLINNAGFGLIGRFDQVPIEPMSDMIRLNCSALTELSYYFLADIRSRSGKIMNVASTAAYQPGPYMTVYFATKAFVLSFSEALSEELKGSGVTVTALCPGPTHTNFGRAAHAENVRLFSRSMDAHRVAKLGYQAMERGKRVVIPGALNQFGAVAAKFLPRILGAKAVKMAVRPTKH